MQTNRFYNSNVEFKVDVSWAPTACVLFSLDRSNQKQVKLFFDSLLDAAVVQLACFISSSVHMIYWELWLLLWSFDGTTFVFFFLPWCFDKTMKNKCIKQKHRVVYNTLNQKACAHVTQQSYACKGSNSENSVSCYQLQRWAIHWKEWGVVNLIFTLFLLLTAVKWPLLFHPS